MSSHTREFADDEVEESVRPTEVIVAPIEQDEDDVDARRRGRHGGRKSSSFGAGDDDDEYDDDDDDEIDFGDDDLLGDLDITSVALSFDGVEESIAANLDDDMVKQALEQGVDLRQYLREVERDLNDVEQGSVDDYLREAGHIAELHGQILSCDRILETMESMLGAFQTDLGAISTEIQSLQEQSLGMNVKLKNRKAVQTDLAALVDDLTITPDLIRSVVKGEVSDSYLPVIMDLDHKLKFLQSGTAKDARAHANVHSEVGMLRTKATDKLRDFLMTSILSLRKANANYDVIQQTTLLRFKHFMLFLIDHSPEHALEIRREYTDTMSKIYYSRFKEYLSKVLKLKHDESADKDDLLGADDSVKKGFFSTKLTLKNRSSIFTLGDRAEILSNFKAAVIIPSVATKKEQRFPYEAIFRSFLWTLIDHATSETLFINDFFALNLQEAQAMFAMIFERALDVFLKHSESFIPVCYDAIALFVCVRLVSHGRRLMHKRRIRFLEATFFDRLESLLHPRLQTVLLTNIASLRDAEAKRLLPITIQPHYVTRRYGEFAAALASLNEGFEDEKIGSLLVELRTTAEKFIKRMAQELPQHKDRLAFLINNYDVILGILQNRTNSKSVEEERFSGLLKSAQDEFAELLLAEEFAGLVSFVKKWDPLMKQRKKSGPQDRIDFDQGAVERVVRHFSSNYKRSIDLLRDYVLRVIANYENGAAIQKQMMTQLIVYFNLMKEIFKEDPFRKLAVGREMVDMQNLMVAVRNATAGIAGL